MKRSVMKWSIKGAHDVLQLRCLYLSNRWNEVENVIESAALNGGIINIVS